MRNLPNDYRDSIAYTVFITKTIVNERADIDEVKTIAASLNFLVTNLLYSADTAEKIITEIENAYFNDERGKTVLAMGVALLGAFEPKEIELPRNDLEFRVGAAIGFLRSITPDLVAASHTFISYLASFYNNGNGAEKKSSLMTYT